jgi:CheY-like chemotaxis protein
MTNLLILVAEDETDIRDLIVFTLEYNKFRVVAAKNGLEAVELATTLMPDLILMDVRMPHMDGYEACKILKTQATTRDIPVVFLSAKDQTADIKKGLALGAVAYVIKPFEPDQLPQYITRILAQYYDNWGQE